MLISCRYKSIHPDTKPYYDQTITETKTREMENWRVKERQERGRERKGRKERPMEMWAMAIGGLQRPQRAGL